MSKIDKQLRETLGDDDWKYTEKPHELKQLLVESLRDIELPEKMQLNKEESNDDYFYGLGNNQAIVAVQQIIDKKCKELEDE